MSDIPFVENPITRRLGQLCDLWLTFEKHPTAFVGRWLLEPMEVDMITGLLAMENTEAAQIPSLFLNFETPFYNFETYSADLIKDFLQFLKSEEAVKDLEEASISVAALTLPEIRDISSWLDLLEQFSKLIPNREASIIAVLNPTTKNNDQDWARWIEKLITKHQHPRVKIMLIDTVELHLYQSLQNKYATQIETLQPRLDMSQAMMEILDEASKDTPNNPGFEYQKKMVAIADKIMQREMNEAEKLAKIAIEITEQQDWSYLAVSVYMALGNGYLRVNDPEKAIDRFEHARQKSIQVTAPDPMLGKYLEIQTIFGLGGCYMVKNNYKKASEVYLEGYPVAAAIPNHQMSLECVRMAAYCLENEKQYKQAWESYEKAWEVGKKMSEEEVKISTLAYVGDALLRLAGKVDQKKKPKEIKSEFTELLGEGWQKTVYKA